MVQLEIKKESQKRSVETTSPTSPRLKKRRVVPDAPQESGAAGDGQKSSKVSKKLAKGSQKRSAETSSTSPHLKKRRVVPDAPQDAGTADDGQKSSKGSKKLSKQKKKKKVLLGASEKSSTTAHGQKSSQAPKKLAKVFCVDFSGLKKSTHRKTLATYFGKFGDVTRVHLFGSSSMGTADRKKGCGSVFFSSKEAVDAVLAQTHLIEGRKVSVCRNKSGKVQLNRNSASRLKVRNIPSKFGKDELSEHFSQFGSIERISLPTKLKDRSAHRGFAYIEFSDELAKTKALQSDQLEVQVDGVTASLSVSEDKEPFALGIHAPDAVVCVVGVPVEVRKAHLKNHFSQFGAIKRLELTKAAEHDSDSTRMAYVAYMDNFAKERALAVKKHKVEVKDQTFKLRVSEHKESVPKKKVNLALQVFVGGIPEEVGKKHLKEHFSQFGNIKFISLPTKPEDRSAHKGFAFVEFSDELAREKALAAGLHEVNAQVVRVCPAETQDSALKKEKNQALEVLVRQIPPEVSRKDLKKHFSQFGSVASITLPTKPEDRSAHKGFAYVEFADEFAKKKTLAAGRHEVKGQMVNVVASKSRESAVKKEVNKALEVKVRQIPQEVSEEDLKEHFSQFGSVASVTLPTKHEDRSAHKGFAFVEFADDCGKKNALESDQHEMNGQAVLVRASKSTEPTRKKETNKALEVIVRQIPQEVSREDLNEHFSQFGSVESITLPTDAKDRSAHKGFAYVEFADQQAKEEALAADQHEVKGQVVNVVARESRKSAVKSEVNKALEVMVRQIPKEVGEEDLKEHFSQFGSVASITLPTSAKPEDRSAHRGFAFIEFADELAKEKAMETDQHEVNGQVVLVRDSKSTEPARKKEINKALEVLVRRIPQEVSREDLKEHFSQFGSVASITLPNNAKDRSAHKGFGFVEFADQQAKEEALAADQHEVKGQVVDVITLETREPTLKKEKKNALEVFVSQIPQEVSREDLKEHFSQFGSVMHITLPSKLEDRSAHRGFAFVEFADQQAKEEALAADQHEVKGQVVKVVPLESRDSSRRKETSKALEVLVRQIPQEVGREDLKEHFSQFGSVMHITLPSKLEDRSAHRGFAYVEFADQQAKEEALAADQHEVNGLVVDVMLPKSLEPSSKRKINHLLEVMVRLIPQEVSKKDLKEHFSQFGSVASVTLPSKPEDRSVHRGFAFVEFVDKLAKEKALAADQHEFHVAGKVATVRVSGGEGPGGVEQNKTRQLGAQDQASLPSVSMDTQWSSDESRGGGLEESDEDYDDDDDKDDDDDDKDDDENDEDDDENDEDDGENVEEDDEDNFEVDNDDDEESDEEV